MVRSGPSSLCGLVQPGEACPHSQVATLAAGPSQALCRPATQALCVPKASGHDDLPGDIGQSAGQSAKGVRRARGPPQAPGLLTVSSSSPSLSPNSTVTTVANGSLRLSILTTGVALAVPLPDALCQVCVCQARPPRISRRGHNPAAAQPYLQLRSLRGASSRGQLRDRGGTSVRSAAASARAPGHHHAPRAAFERAAGSVVLGPALEQREEGRQGVRRS